MTKQAITKLIKQPESEIFEKKPSLSDIRRIVEVVCSFVNSNGGKILIGVSEKGKMIGVDIGKNTIERLTDTIIDNTDPKIYPEILTLTKDKKNLILILTKASPQKPHTAYGRSFKRAGKNTKLMSQTEYERLLLEKNKDKMQFDTEICKDATFKDISIRKVNWYLRGRKKARNVSDKVKISDKQLLTNLKCLKSNKPTNAGILFFAKDPLNYVSHAQLRLIRIKGIKIYGNILDRLDCKGTLWEMVGQAEEFIGKNVRLLGIRSEKSFRREDKFDYPIKALREAIINALIHRDYYNSADVRVFILDDRIEIVSPGSFPEGVTPEHPEHKPVNKILSNLMYDIGFIEKYGSGIYLINELCLENGNKKPVYDISPNQTMVTFKSQVKDVTVIEIDKKIIKEFNKRQRIFIKSKIKNVSRSQYAKLVNCSIRTASSDLQDLLSRKMVKKIGAGKYIRYIRI
ncbi:MAG: RNA-binding domain-containing protein [bacterium]